MLKLDFQLQSVDQNVITPIHYYDRECKDARTELTKLEKENKKYEKTLRNPVSRFYLTIKSNSI